MSLQSRSNARLLVDNVARHVQTDDTHCTVQLMHMHCVRLLTPVAATNRCKYIGLWSDASIN